MTADQTDKRFSHTYLCGGEPLPDSARARVRLGVLLSDIGPSAFEIARAFEKELGSHVPWGPGGPLVKQFLEKCELRDFLDAISIVWSTFGQRDQRVRHRWLAECKRIFVEERLRYVINGAGGVRFSVDSQFEADVQATLHGLSHPAMKGALASYEHALKAISDIPPDGKTAIRSLFESVEIAFKTLCPGPPRIGAAEITKYLLPMLTGHYDDDKTARQVALKLARSLAEWVNAAHFYRHGQTGLEPVQPPLDLAIAVVAGVRHFCGGSRAFMPRQ